MAKGRPRKIGVTRTKSGRASRAVVKVAGGADAVAYAIYFISSNDRVKVGYTSNLAARIATIESNSGYPAQLLGVIHVASQVGALELEAAFHRDLTNQGRHFQGEWFSLNRAEVARLLNAARGKGLRVTGGDDGATDVPILSSLAYAGENVLSLEDLS